MSPLVRSLSLLLAMLTPEGSLTGTIRHAGSEAPIENPGLTESHEVVPRDELEAPGPDYALARVDWLEPVVLTTDTPGFALVSGRAVKLRAFVTAPEPGALPPQVYIKVLDAQQRVLAEGTMSAPASGTLGMQPDLGSLAAAYLFELRSEWVQPGLQVDLVVDSGPGGTDPNPDNNHLLLRPAVDAPNVLYLTVVPVRTTAEGLASLPDEEHGPEATRRALKSLLMAAYPLSDVKVRIHAPYMARVTTQFGNWGTLLGEINNLRIAEGNEGNYLGFIKPSGGLTVGNSFMPGTVAIVASGTPWLKGTVMHELGHNAGRGHVDCGKLDTSGQTWGYNAERGVLVNPTETHDVMSYCAPSWVSRASYLSIQKVFRTGALDRPDDPTDWL